MDMSSFLADAYFTEYKSKAKYMMGSPDTESVSLKEAITDLTKHADEPLGYAAGCTNRSVLLLPYVQWILKFRSFLQRL